MVVIFFQTLEPMESACEDDDKLFKCMSVVLHFCHVDDRVKVIAMFNVSLLVDGLHPSVVETKK